jgi:ribosomal protein L28
MPKVCDICGKQKSRGNTRKLLRGHYNITGKRDFKPNLQKATLDGERVLACVKCIRTNTRKALLKQQKVAEKAAA